MLVTPTRGYLRAFGQELAHSAKQTSPSLSPPAPAAP
jgi:hypothetical protein